MSPHKCLFLGSQHGAMGVKQEFGRRIVEGVPPRALKDIWAERQGDVILFDASNFLMVVARLVAWPGLPRLKEFKDLLKRILHDMLAACPGAQFHFIFDGLRDELAYNNKANEGARRKLENLAETAEAVEHLARSGRWRKWVTTPKETLKDQLIEVVKTCLDGDHMILHAQSRCVDADVVLALHALKSNAGLLVSDDSDFLVSFQGPVLLVRSLLTVGDSKVVVVSWQQRLDALQTDPNGLRVMACQAGTDLTPSVEGELPEGPWQEAVKRMLPKQEADLFIRQYDLEAYVDNADGSWSYCGELACGVTSCYPPGPLDPLARDFCHEKSEHVAHMVRAFCHGRLTGQVLHLMLHQRVYSSGGSVDFALPGQRPVYDFIYGHGAWLSRVAGFLHGDVPEVDSDAERDVFLIPH